MSTRFSPTPAFAPARVVAVDLVTGSVTDPDEKPVDATDYRRIRALASLGTIPIVLTTLRVSDGDDEEQIVDQCRKATWDEARDRIVSAFEAHGLETPASAQDIARFATASPTTHDSPLISATICTLNDNKAAIRTAERIANCTYSNFEILIVDNSDSPNPLADKVADHFASDPRVRHVHEPNRGLSNARNRGWTAAKGDIVVFTDDDVLVSPAWLSSIADAFASADHVGCVTGPIIPAEIETPAQDLLEQYGGYNKGFSRQVFDNHRWRRDDILYPYNAGRFGSGANMALSRKALETLNGFATELGAGTPTHGGEDIDVLQRVISSGFAIVYEPSALMWHRHRRSYSQLRRQMYRYGIGLGATITKWTVESRHHNFEVLRRFPKGFAYLLSPSSQKNNFKTSDYPRSLTALELIGLILGPIAYFRSRQALRHGQGATKAAPATRK